LAQAIVKFLALSMVGRSGLTATSWYSLHIKTAQSREYVSNLASTWTRSYGKHILFVV
jgi:hypothetical protein